MTGGYHLLCPRFGSARWRSCSPTSSRSTRSQVESRSRSPAHQGSFVRDVLAGVHVSQFLKPGQVVPMLQPDDSLDDVLASLADAPFSVLPVVDGESRLLGIVDLEEVHVVPQASYMPHLILAADLMQSDVRPITPETTLDRALELFVENDLLILPVVKDLETRQVVGMVRRSEISNAYIRRIQGPPAGS